MRGSDLANNKTVSSGVAFAAGTSNPFKVEGGIYVLEAIGTFAATGFGLQKLGPDDATYIAASPLMTANGGSSALYLTGGTYRVFADTASSGIFWRLQRVPDVE